MPCNGVPASHIVRLIKFSSPTEEGLPRDMILPKSSGSRGGRMLSIL